MQQVDEILARIIHDKTDVFFSFPEGINNAPVNLGDYFGDLYRNNERDVIRMVFHLWNRVGDPVFQMSIRADQIKDINKLFIDEMNLRGLPNRGDYRFEVSIHWRPGAVLPLAVPAKA